MCSFHSFLPLRVLCPFLLQFFNLLVVFLSTSRSHYLLVSFLPLIFSFATSKSPYLLICFPHFPYLFITYRSFCIIRFQSIYLMLFLFIIFPHYSFLSTSISIRIYITNLPPLFFLSLYLFPSLSSLHHYSLSLLHFLLLIASAPLTLPLFNYAVKSP